MTARKLTHKALKEMGRAFGGLYFDGNIYAHENRVHYVSSMASDWRREERIAEAKQHDPEIAGLLEEIAALAPDGVRVEQIAYSAGYYGNNGQLHKIDLFRDSVLVRSVVLYC